MTQREFDRYLTSKYGTVEKINSTHHYETKEVKNMSGAVIVPEGLRVESDYTVTYYDYYLTTTITKPSTDIVEEVTNYDYESKIEDAKRSIFLLKQMYVPVVQDDMAEMMEYKKGSSQYVDGTLKVGENIRLYS